MKTSFTQFKWIMTIVSLFLVSSLYAQFPIVQEAESYNSTGARYPSVDSRSGFSGQQGLNLEAAYGSKAQYTVNVVNEGTYDMTIYYSTMQYRSFYIKVNNQVSTPILITDLTNSWDGSGTDGIKSVVIQVYLQSGDNTIELGGYYHPNADNGHSPAIDKFEITESSTSIAVPATQITAIQREAEDGTLSGTSIANFSAFSGGKGVGGSLSSQSTITFTDIVAPEAGTYDLSIYYVTMDTRSSYIKVNYQKRSIVSFDEHTDSWGDGSDTSIKPAVFKKTIQIYLNQGTNKLVIGAYSTYMENIDKISIEKSGLSISTPANETLSTVFDFTDSYLEANESNATSSENLAKLFDNDEFTLYSVPNVTSTQVTVKTKYPILLNGYSIATSVVNPVSMDNWIVEYSIDGSTNWTVITPSSTTTNGNIKVCYKDNRNIAAQYYRLTATGTTNVEVAEWQLHGVPYITANANFPEDLTTDANSLSASNTGIIPTWNEVYQNTIDNLVSTKYTTTDGVNTFWLEYDLSEAKIVDSYSLSVPFSDPLRNPKTWTLSGFNNDNWTVLDSRENTIFAVQGSMLNFNIASPGSYTKYKLDVTACNGANNNSHLLEWQLYEKVNNTPTYNKDGLQDNNITISSKNNLVHIISSKSDATFRVYNLYGSLVKSGICENGTAEFYLNSGFYLVTVNTQTVKLIVK